MPYFNKVILIGNITKDIELRQTPEGKEFVRFSIAVNRKPTKGATTTADFFNVSAWNKTATFIAQWFKKGDPILIEGSIHNNHYKDKNGADRYSTDIKAESVSFVSIRGEESLQKVKENFSEGEITDFTPNFEDIGLDDDLPF